MELGAGFEDDLFEKPSEKKENAPLEYEAKTCSPKWFMDSKCVEKNNVDLLNNLRYQADFHYHHKNYKEASELYEHCLKMIPLNNTAARRECFENLARSSLHENQTRKALEWALQMHDIRCNADQSLVSLNLLATVCHKLGRFPEEMEALGPCLAAHHHYPEIWLRVAYCHAGLLGIWLPYSEIKVPVVSDTRLQCCAFKERTLKAASADLEGITEFKTLDTPNPGNEALDILSNSSNPEVDNTVTANQTASKCESCDILTQLIIGCLIRAKLLINATNHNQSTIAIGKKQTLERKIETCFKVLEVRQDFLEEATKLLQADLLETMAGNEEPSPLCETKPNGTKNENTLQNDLNVECGIQDMEDGS